MRQGAIRGGRRGIKEQSGFALLLVMWVVALLAVLAAQIAADVRSELQISRSRLELAQARAIAEAGITLAVSGLIAPDVTVRWRADGSTHAIRYGDGTVAVTVQDEAGKIDLNQSPIEPIAGLLAEFGVGDKDDRDAILSEIMERRQDVLANPQAAPPPPPSFANIQAPPPPGPTSQAAFVTNSELRQLTAMPHSLYDRIAPFVTVYSKRPTVNPLTAPREVLAALPGASPAVIASYIQARDAIPAGQPAPVLPTLGVAAAAYLSNSEANAVTIIAKATTDSGVTFDREAVVSVDQAMNPRFLEWHSIAPPNDKAGEQSGP